MTNKYRNNIINILILFYAVLLAVAGIYDLQISHILTSWKSGWVTALQDYGEIPGIITILTGILIYHKKKRHSSNSRTLLYNFILLYSAFMLFLYTGYLLLRPFTTSIMPIIIFSTVFTFGSVIISKNLKVTFSDELFRFSKVILMMGISGYLLFVQPLKLFWGRVRFRDLDSAFSNFSPWYMPNGITGHESFPSGHSAMGFILISFFLLFRNNSLSTRVSIYIFVLTWAFILAFSRIVIGAHFLSDAVVGSAGMVFSYLYFSKAGRTEKI